MYTRLRLQKPSFISSFPPPAGTPSRRTTMADRYEPAANAQPTKSRRTTVQQDPEPIFNPLTLHKKTEWPTKAFLAPLCGGKPPQPLTNLLQREKHVFQRFSSPSKASAAAERVARAAPTVSAATAYRPSNSALRAGAAQQARQQGSAISSAALERSPAARGGRADAWMRLPQAVAQQGVPPPSPGLRHSHDSDDAVVLAVSPESMRRSEAAPSAVRSDARAPAQPAKQGASPAAVRAAVSTGATPERAMTELKYTKSIENLLAVLPPTPSSRSPVSPKHRSHGNGAVAGGLALPPRESLSEQDEAGDEASYRSQSLLDSIQQSKSQRSVGPVVAHSYSAGLLYSSPMRSELNQGLNDSVMRFQSAATLGNARPAAPLSRQGSDAAALPKAASAQRQNSVPRAPPPPVPRPPHAKRALFRSQPQPQPQATAVAAQSPQPRPAPQPTATAVNASRQPSASASHATALSQRGPASSPAPTPANSASQRSPIVRAASGASHRPTAQAVTARAPFLPQLSPAQRPAASPHKLQRRHSSGLRRKLSDFFGLAPGSKDGYVEVSELYGICTSILHSQALASGLNIRIRHVA